MQSRPNISNAIIRRLPRYRRCLGHLQKNGVKKVSSRELSNIIGYTASQIRQDFNTFGEFWTAGLWLQCETNTGRINKILGLNRSIELLLLEW